MFIKRFPRKAGLLALGLIAVQPALAETDLTAEPFELLLKREVVTASKLARQVSDAPSAVAIVTAEDIRTFGYRTLADVINSMRGLYTTYDRKYHYMGGRAFGRPDDFAGRVMLMIDGQPTQDNVFSQAYIGQSGLLDMALIERVEYVPGTGSVSYGNNALLGIINVVTKKGADFGGAQVALEAGSFGEHRERVTFGKQFDNGADLLLSASVLQSDGQNLFFPEYGQTARGQDGEQNQRFFAKLIHQGWKLEAAYSNREKDVPTAPRDFTLLNDPYRAKDRNAFVAATYEADLGLELKSSTRFYAGQYENRDFFKYETPTPPDQRMYRQNASRGEWFGLDQKFVANWFENHTLVLGMEYRDDQRQDYVKRFLDASMSSLPADTEGFWDKRQTISVYAEDAIWLSPQWQTVLGVRHDSTSDGFAMSSPRLALIYNPSEVTTIKASYSESFRLPNAYDKYYAIGSFAPKPEQVRASELVLMHHFSAKSRMTATAYHYDLLGVAYRAGVDATNSNVYLNSGHIKSDGVEVEGEQRWASGFAVKSSVALQRARDELGEQLANSPNLLAKLNVSSPFMNTGVRAGFEAQYVGPRKTMGSVAKPDVDGYWLAGFPLFNLTLSNEKKWHGVLWSATVRNLFDRRYEAVASLQKLNATTLRETLPMDGRTFWLQASYDF